jgi:thiaminase/transcriptional activator TenA
MRHGCDAIWDALYGHPLLRELAAGTLPLEKFRFFLEQDNFFLEDYARCLAMGAAKSRNEIELRYFTTDLNALLEEELPSNRDLLATSYLQAVALRGGPLEVMAALLPCAWSYIEIAERLRRETTSEHPVYAGWIAYFSLPANVEMVASMRRDLDALVAEEGLSSARRAELVQIFATSSRLERGFWDMAYAMEQWIDLDRPGVP